MKYSVMAAEETTKFLSSFRKNPCLCRINMRMRSDGKILIARGVGDDLGYLPDKFVVVNTMHQGGSILGYPDSLCLVAFDRTRPSWLEDLANYLRGRNLKTELSGNDVLVDGFKVAGLSCTPLYVNGIVYYAFFVSFTVNLSDVLTVCKKPMRKIPKGLGEYGIQKSEVMKALGVETEE